MGRVYFSGCLSHNTGVLKRGQKLTNILKTEEVVVFQFTFEKWLVKKMSSDWVFPKSPTQPTNMPDGPGHSSLGCEWTSHSRHSLHCRSLWWLLRGNLHCPGSVCTGPRVGANCTVAVSRSVVLAFKSSSPWFWYEHNSSLQRFVIVVFFVIVLLCTPPSCYF